MTVTGAAQGTPKALLDSLTEVNGYVGVAIQLGEVLVPIGKALVSKIHSIGSGSETITYQLLVQGDDAELDEVVKVSTDDLTAINAELVRLGKSPLVVPPTS